MALPSAKAILATTLLPTCLGYYRYEYGVSYGYGTATALTAFLTLRSLLANPTFTAGSFACMAQLHALAIVFYGVRLNAFLLFREAFIPRFRKMRETIEDRQRVKEVDTGLIGKFINRTPFILSCAVLYAGLASSPLISAKLIAMGNGNGYGYNPTCKIGLMVYKALVGTTYFGFLLGAIGDLTKTVVKGRKGSDHLVTGGVFSIFRHPNYTGEVIGWVSSFLASLVAVMSVVMTGTGTGTGTAGINKLSMVKEFGPLLPLSFAGVLGIAFVLFAAASNLEKRQKEKYGDDEIYAKWIASSWSGPKLKQSKPVGKE